MNKLILNLSVFYLVLSCINSVYGQQWEINGGIPNRYVETRNAPAIFNARSVGIGNFTSYGFEPLSALHVNSNFLDLSPNFPKGEVFMTTGPATLDNVWQLTTGAGNGTPRFTISVPANSDDAVLSTVQNGAMRFQTNGTQRMFIQAGGVTDGFIGIGSGFNAPISLLHVNGVQNSTGSLFETTKDAAEVNRWRMSSGNAFAPRFSITNPSGAAGFNVDMETHNNGQINFSTNTNNPNVTRSVSIQGGMGNVAHGQVAFGNVLPANFDARSRLHLHKSDAGDGVGGNFIQFTNALTSGGDTPQNNNAGSRIGINANGDLLIRQSENNPIFMLTNGTNRLFINDAINAATAGYVGINNVAPTARLDVSGDLRIRNVQEVPADALLLGLQHGPNANDHDVRRLDFTGNTNQYLAGTGGWATLPVVDASNGCAISNLDPGHVALGQALNQPGNPAELKNTRQIPMNNNNVVFTDNSIVGGNRVGIGTEAPAGKLHVKVNEDIQAGWTKAVVIDHKQTLSNGYAEGIDLNMWAPNDKNEGINMNVNEAYRNTGADISVDVNNATSLYGEYNNGVIAKVYDANHTNIGFEADLRSNESSTLYSYGVYSSVRDAKRNYGGRFSAKGNDNYTSSINAGLITTASGPTTASGVNYGIYSYCPNQTNSASSFAGWFQGDVNVQGQLTTPTGTVGMSDQMFKNNISNISGATALINQLQPRVFYFDTTNYPEIGFESGLQMGLIAQEVSNVLPGIVSTHTMPIQYDTAGNALNQQYQYLGVEYQELIPLLIAGMQEQQAMIDSLSNELASVQGCLAAEGLCQMGARNAQPNSEEEQQVLLSQIDVILSNRNNIVLNQNVPNPFAEKTIITYSIPKSIGKAQIHFYNAEGALINTVDIKERGAGQLNVFADDLTSGIYMYTLVADGKIVDTKRMMKN